MIVCFGKTAHYVIFAVAEGADETVVFVRPILVQPFAPTINEKYVKLFQSLHMSAMDVLQKTHVLWKKEFILLHSHKKSMRKCVPSHVKAYRSLKKKP